MTGRRGSALLGALLTGLLLVAATVAASARAAGLAREAGQLRRAVHLRAAVLSVADSLAAVGACTAGTLRRAGAPVVDVTWQGDLVHAVCRWTVQARLADGAPGLEQAVRRRGAVAARREHS